MALVRFVAVLIAVTASAPAASYWQELSVITGKVSDARGIPIPSAAVRLALREGGASRETLTVEDGTFRFDAVPAGTYRLVIEMQGFQRFVLESFDIAGEMARELSLTMQSPAPSRPEPGQARPGAAAGPPGARGAMNPPSFPEVSPVDVSPTGEVQGGLPGVDALQAGAAAGGADVLVVAGNPGLTLDAMDWNDPRMRERMMDGARRMGFMINEVRAQGPGSGMGGMGFGGGGPMGGGRPVFGGGFGPGAGGRGGRMSQPKINGAVDFRYANSALNARPYSLTGEELTAPLQIQNNFGFTVGGVLPGAAPAAGRRGPGGGRGGGWFFNYSGSRNRSPFDVLTTVPTELERRGDFSQTLMRSGMSAGTPVVIYDPATPGAALFENARIPPSRIDAASSALLKYIPLPNLPGSVQNFTMQRGLVDSNDQLGLRINTALGSGNNMNFSYSHRRGGSVSSGIFPGLDSERSNRAHNAMVGGMYRIQQRLLFNYRVSFNRVRNLSSNDFAFEDDVAGKLGITGISGDPINYGIPGIRLTNYGDLSLGSPALNQNQTLTMAGSMMKIGTRHNIRTGLDLAWSRRNIQTDRNPRGTFDFTGFATSAFDAHGRPIAGTGYDFADFLLGHPYASSRQYGSGRSYLRGKSINVFFQDDWRVNARFTINYGVRYEYVQPFYEKNDRMVNLDVAPGFTAVSPVFPGATGPYGGRFTRSLIGSDKNNISPRFGIAWKPTPSSKWVVRSGYGIFYNPSVYSYIYGQLIQQPPFAISQDLLTTLSNPLTIQQGFPDQPDVAVFNTYAIDPGYRIGYVQQWNLDIQTELFRLYSISVGYNGSRGTRLDVLRAPNRAPQGSSPVETEDNRFIADAGNFVYQTSEAGSVMHALQARLNRRFSRGFRFQASYTLAKSIDNASGIGGGGLTVVQDEFNIRGERSLSGFDQRHRFEFGCNFELPFGERRRFFPNANLFLQQLISGWNLDASLQLLSGTPSSPRLMGNVSNNSGTGSNFSERPDTTGLAVTLPDSRQSTSAYFNTLAFAVPPPGQFGNAGRNTIPGPGTNLLNMSLRKGFRLDDSNRRMEVRWMVSNVFNHPNWGGLGTVVNATNYGRVTNVRTMRRMEFNLRVNF